MGLSWEEGVCRVGTEVDLVCGPAGPLPGSSARYQLVEHLGTGGQAEVYRGVRISGGLASSPVTVKVFREATAGRFSVDEQLGFWDKGDAVLQDLGSRGVRDICLRVDGFTGAPPRPPRAPISSDAPQIPVQVLDYIPGSNLIDTFLADARTGGAPTVDAPRVLRTLAKILVALHHPSDGELAVLHMDVKPANILVAPHGGASLIDFTASRYHDTGHMTGVAHSLESGGPEALDGGVALGPAYDVHGFGAVAYYLVTGWHPREERGGRGVLRRHPLLDEHPLVARHLFAPLADAPGERPKTHELDTWTTRLVQLMARIEVGDQLARWGVRPQVTLAVPEAPAVPAPRGATAPLPVLTDETLRALDASRGAAYPTAPLAAAPAPPASAFPAGSASVRLPMEYSPYPVPEGAYTPAVAPPPPPPRSEAPRPHPASPYRAPYPPYARGRGLVSLSVFWFLLCWVIWLAVDFFRTHSAQNALLGLVFVAVGMVGVYWLTRLAGYLIRTTMEWERPRSTLVPNLTTSVFLLTCGIAVLSFTPLDIRRVVELF
jgi:serine/threonine protein kinase